MKASKENKYKECLPAETVQYVKSILKSIGVELEEHWIDTGMEGFYALRVNVPGSNLLGTNGKGATREYAQASAYAEFMERIQNSYLGPGDFEESTKKYKGFYYEPEEKLMTPEELAEQHNAFNELIINIAAKSRKNVNKEPPGRAELLAMWQYPVSPDCGDKFVAVKYYSVRNNRYEYLPHAVSMRFYHSNGMCAGNKPEEALVQGLSEVFERYVNIRLVKDRLRLPVIPDWHLRKYERLYKAIKKIEENSRYKVLVKDGSLGMGYPVVVLIIIDRERQTYGVKLGAHPEFEIALERTLSEAFQGKNIEAFTGLSFLRFDDAGIQLADNIYNIAKIGMGQYPIELFSEAAGYEFRPFADITGKSNGEVLKDMLELVTSQGYDVLIRDVSYLDFPAFHIIVPGFSEVYEPELAEIQTARSALKVKKAIRKLHEASDEELQDIVRYLMQKQNALAENTFSALAGVEFREKFIGGNYEHLFLMGACLYKMGSYREATAFLGMTANGMLGTEEEVYYRCIAHYAAAMAEQKPVEEIEAILRLFYPEDIVQKVCGQMGKPREVMEKLYPSFNCFNCSECSIKDKCSYSIARDMKLAIKEKQAAARLKDLRELGI